MQHFDPATVSAAEALADLSAAIDRYEGHPLLEPSDEDCLLALARLADALPVEDFTVACEPLPAISRADRRHAFKVAAKARTQHRRAARAAKRAKRFA